MRKLIISTILAGLLLAITGCGAAGGSGESQAASEATPSEASVADSEASGISEGATEASGEQMEEEPVSNGVTERLGSAVRDAYDGLEIDAFIRERAAILPGFKIPVTVTVKNTGAETIDYVKGSGSYTIPDAVFINVDGLQRVLPTDRLGMATMDFRTDELKPGDQLEFDMYIMAIEPNAEFDAYTLEMYGGDGAYIADKAWSELQEAYPSLTPAQSGSYKAQAYFLYYVRDESGVSDFTAEPSGYAEHDFTISVG